MSKGTLGAWGSVAERYSQCYCVAERYSQCYCVTGRDSQCYCPLTPCNSFYLPLTLLYTKTIVLTPLLPNSLTPKYILNDYCWPVRQGFGRAGCMCAAVLQRNTACSALPHGPYGPLFRPVLCWREARRCRLVRRALHFLRQIRYPPRAWAIAKAEFAWQLP